MARQAERHERDPALLEYAGQDMFKIRIFPIEPNSKKRISLSYTQALKSDQDLISYLLPLNTEKFSAKLIPDVSVVVKKWPGPSWTRGTRSPPHLARRS